MQKITFICDICGIEKKVSNNWFCVTIPWHDPMSNDDTPDINVHRWNNLLCGKHVCGESCLDKMIHRLLSNQERYYVNF